jgi:uncharacterized delta-60 repeat protein
MNYRTFLVGLTASLAAARVLVSTGCGGDPSTPSLQAGDGATGTPDAPIDAPAAFLFADVSFGVGGVARFSHAADWTGAEFSNALLDPDDSIIVVSTPDKTRDSAELARLTAGGQIDRAFAPSSTGVPTSVGHDVYGLTLDGQGKLVLVGSNGDESQALRLLPDGTKDPSFNAYVPVGNSFDQAGLGGPVTESTGSVIACLSFGSSRGVIRFASNGAAQDVGDGGTAGRTCPNLRLSDGSFLALVNGTVPATGGQTAKVVHLTQDLVLDSKFGAPVGDPTTFSSIQGLAALESRAFYAVGTRGVQGVSVARYTPAGVLDSTFAAAGIADLSQTLIGNTSVALQADGNIVVAGAAVTKTMDAHMVARVVRLLASGALDTSFGIGGVAEYDPGTDIDARQVYVQQSGRIVALGTARDAKGVQDVVAMAFRAH